MSSQANKLKIGLFVVMSLLLSVATVIWLGASRYFEDSKIAVAYFTESVQGLESDSPVKFRGVPVGRIKAIRMAPDGRLIEVVMSLDRNFKLTDDMGIKMNLLGLTGQKYLEMDTFRPDQVREMIDLDFTPPYRVINTYSSDIREIGNALEKIFHKVNALDVDRISNHLLKVAVRLDKILADPKLDAIGSDAADALREIKDTARKFNEEISRVQVGKNITRTLDKTSEFLQESTETIRSVDRAIRRTDNNFNRLSQKLDRSADNLIDFTRMIRLKPSSIIFGTDEKSGQKR
ncbi:MAG: MlaD family protein [Desulfomonile sp.]|jgi:phospholipid/cholesterol/gamma-HCH transport system substrate-binding protein